jgi:hypothetical protein
VVIGQHGGRKTGIGLTLFVVACAWALSGFGAFAAFVDSHNPSLAHVPAHVSHCGSGGTCQATFTYRDRSYLVTGVSGTNGSTTTLYVDRSDPYKWAQAQSPLSAYGPFAAVVVLTVAGFVAWCLVQRRQRAQTPPTS